MNDNFIDVLLENNSDSMEKFLLENGKKPKPHCPFYYDESEDEENGRDTKHEVINGRN